MPNQVVYLTVLLALCGCTPTTPRTAELASLQSRWDSEEALWFRLEINQTRGVASEPFSIALHIARGHQETGKAVSLLAGRFVFTFVPLGSQGSEAAHARYSTFSGAGGVDYSGEKPLEFEVRAPAVPGRYWLHMTVQSTPADIDGFLRLARMSAGAGPWWRGNQSTRPVLVEIGPSKDR